MDDTFQQMSEGDLDSLTATSSTYPRSWSSHSLPTTSTSPNMLPPSDCSVQLNNMYLECKTDMLEVIEEGLQLKLEIQGIKDQFLHLIHDFEEFEQKDQHSAVKSPTITMPHAAASDGVQTSVARTRVRALYEARKARIRARRSSASVDSHKDFDTMAPPSKMQKIQDDNDKENAYRPTVIQRKTSESSFSSDQSKENSVPGVMSSQEPMRAMTWSIRRFLTPIKEEFPDRSAVNTNCLPVNFLSHKGNTVSRRPGSRSKDRANKENRRSAGDVMTSQRSSKSSVYSSKSSVYSSKSSVYSYDSVPEVSRKSMKPGSRLSLERLQPEGHAAPEKPKRTTKPTHRTPKSRTPSKGDVVACIGGMNIELSPDLTRSMPLRGCNQSPNQFEPASPILEAKVDSTVQELNDISQISQISKCDVHEQVSSANLSGAFHSTFNYPLHSTLNYPLHSTFSMSDDVVPKLSGEDSQKDNSDTRTTISEPSATVSRRKSCRQPRKAPLLSLPRQSMDDSCLDYNTFVSKMSSGSSTAPSFFSPKRHRTPSRKPEATLCREHGIHPTFGGLCLFQNENSVTLNTTTDEEFDPDENGNTPKVTMNVTETDCDSSYLSEFMDDQQMSIDVDEYAARYDARVRVLKRQTGQAELFEIKDPIGLSESDFHFDITKKDFSLDATRASLPNFNGLSTMVATRLEEDDSESTLHASSPRKSLVKSVFNDSPDFDGANETLISVNQRQLSGSTTEESPESNTGISVPVNSPNITDSGGSSSRQNTDNYEYPEVILEDTRPSVDRISLPGSHTTHSSRSRHSHRTPSTRSHHSHHSSKSHQPARMSSKVIHNARKRYSSTPDTRTARPATSVSSHDNRRPSRECRSSRHQSRAPSHDWDSGCSSSRSRSKEYTISDNTGRRRTILHNSPAAQNLPRERKKVLAKKLKHFSNSFYQATNTGNLQIQTLGHF